MVSAKQQDSGVRPAERERHRRLPVTPAGWWFDALLVVAFTGLTIALDAGHLLRADVVVRDWCLAHQPHALHLVARAGNLLGQGGFFTLLCLALALFLGWRRHSVRPILPVAMALVLTYVSISALKDVTNRAAPLNPGVHPERFGSGGISYPSGHLTNALVWYGVLALLLASWLPGTVTRTLRIAPPIILTVTTVYLGFHWLSDTVGGIVLGLFLWRLIARVRWNDLPLGGWLHRKGWDNPALSEPSGSEPGRSDPGAAAHHAGDDQVSVEHDEVGP